MITRKQAIKAADAKALAALSSSTIGADGHIADFVFWVIAQSWQMPCPDVAAVLQKHGLDPLVLMPEAVSYSVGFTRAYDSVRSAVQSLGYIITVNKVNGPGGAKRINILKTRTAAITDPQDEGSMLCATDGKSAPTIERDDPGGVCQKILDKTHELVGVYRKADLAVSVAALLRRWSGVPLLDGGYLVVPGATAEIERMKAAIEEMGAGTIGQLAAYSKDARSVQTATMSVNASLEAQLNAFAKEAEAYASRGGLRASTIERRIEECKALQVQANLYKAILGAAVNSVDEKVKKVEESLQITLGIIEQKAAAT